jgi:hypothetical protein
MVLQNNSCTQGFYLDLYFSKFLIILFIASSSLWHQLNSSPQKNQKVLESTIKMFDHRWKLPNTTLHIITLHYLAYPYLSYPILTLPKLTNQSLGWAIDTQSCSCSFEGVLGVVRKPGRGYSNFMFYCILWSNVLKSFEGENGCPLLTPLPPPSLFEYIDALDVRVGLAILYYGLI